MDTLDRFLIKVNRVESGCWEWTAARMQNGYGRFRVGSQVDGSRRQVLAHRFAYEEFVGPIPEGLEVHHVCRNRACVNPEHLRAVTHRENLLDGDTFAAANVAKVECPKGHPYDEENTYRNPNTGHRLCRACHREHLRSARKAVVPC